MKKVFRLTAICLSLCIALFAIPLSASAQSAGGYRITGYDITMAISENNVYNITETISVNFEEQRHGIYRDIPLEGGDRIYDVNVEGAMFTVDHGTDYASIKIGDPDKLVSGDVTYRISYSIEFADDESDAYDEVYCSLIGTGWDTEIDNITFSITLPKEFDAGNVGFSAGASGTGGYDPDELTYEVDGNTVNGTLSHLGAYEGLTVRIELPEGYFAKRLDIELPDWLTAMLASLVWQLLMGK